MTSNFIPQRVVDQLNQGQTTRRYWIDGRAADSARVRSVTVFRVDGVLDGDTFYYLIGSEYFHIPWLWTHESPEAALKVEKARCVRTIVHLQNDLEKTERLLKSLDLPPQERTFLDVGNEEARDRT